MLTTLYEQEIFLQWKKDSLNVSILRAGQTAYRDVIATFKASWLFQTIN